MRILTLYHGSQTPLERPRFGYDNRHNDFGPGLYCSESLDMAKEWSSGQYRGGYANEYFIDTDGLGILDLNGRSILCWLAILIKNRPVRKYTGLATEAESWLDENFGMDLSGYDIIRGYRADDSYYSFARAFLNNQITVEQLRDAMHLGSLGEQIVIKSRRAFDRLVYEGSVRAEHPEYYARRTARDDAARIAYREATATFDRDGILMTDLIRGEVSPDDGRLQRAVPGRRDDKSRRDGGVRHRGLRDGHRRVLGHVPEER